MHKQSIETWEHEHVFLGVSHDRNARRTWLVVGLTAIMMVAEIVAGTIFGSMALVADGWHMSTHAAALGISALAYDFARRYARDPRFSYGTGKFGELAAILERLDPGADRAPDRLRVGRAPALAGRHPLRGGDRRGDPRPRREPPERLAALRSPARTWARPWRRRRSPSVMRHDGMMRMTNDTMGIREWSTISHGPSDSDDHGSHDTNLRAAYLHVLADALTSVLAIAALLGGRLFGWTALDPAMGIVGAIVIALWSLGLLRSAGAALLDVVPDRSLEGAVRGRLEIDGDRVSDLHLWRLGPGHTGVTVSVVDVRSEAARRLQGASRRTARPVARHRRGPPLHPRGGASPRRSAVLIAAVALVRTAAVMRRRISGRASRRGCRPRFAVSHNPVACVAGRRRERRSNWRGRPPASRP